MTDNSRKITGTPQRSTYSAGVPKGLQGPLAGCGAALALPSRRRRRHKRKRPEQLPKKAVRSALKPHTSLWLRCMKMRRSMTESFGPLNWCNKTHDEQPCLRCIFPPHSWRTDLSITSNIPTSTTYREAEKERYGSRTVPLLFLQRICYPTICKMFT
jgi:hypothetical protein